MSNGEWLTEDALIERFARMSGTRGSDAIHAAVQRTLIARYDAGQSIVVRGPADSDTLGEALPAWSERAAPGDRFIFEGHSLDHDRAAKMPAPPARAGVAAFGIDEIAALADGLKLHIAGVCAFGAFTREHHFLARTAAGGPFWDRVLSWAVTDDRLHDFLVFLECGVVANLGSCAAAQLLVALEKPQEFSAGANVAWLQSARRKNQRLGAGLSRKGLEDVIDVDWDTLRDTFDVHLTHEENRVALHRIHSALLHYAWPVALEDFVGAAARAELERLFESALTDCDVAAMAQSWYKDPRIVSALTFHGVSLGAALEYDTMIDTLVFGLHCFPLERLGNLARRI